MTEIAITDARDRLASVIDQARKSPVYFTRRGVKLVAVVDADYFDELLEAADELADIRAASRAWEEAQALGETPIPWEAAKRDLGL
jgi:prevent-host-death family protein